MKKEEVIQIIEKYKKDRTGDLDKIKKNDFKYNRHLIRWKEHCIKICNDIIEIIKNDLPSQS